jgi:hypothetical protein
MALFSRWSSGEVVTAAKLNATSIPIVTATSDITTPYTDQIIFNTTSNTLHQYNGSTWLLYDANTQWIYKAATESVTSSAALQNDDTFVFAMVANAAYAIEAYIAIDGAADPAGGIITAFTGPASSSLFYTNFAVNTGGLTQYNAVAQGVGVSRASGTNSTTVMTFEPKGTFVVAGTAGNAQWQWGQNVSNVTPTRVLSGSWMKFTRIA